MGEALEQLGLVDVYGVVRGTVKQTATAFSLVMGREIVENVAVWRWR